MERCKHCGEVIDLVDLLYCPACGNRLTDEVEVVEPIEKKKKKKDKKEKTEIVVPVKNTKSEEKVVDKKTEESVVLTKTEKASNVEKTKTTDYNYVKSGVRKSYIVFGVFALLIGALFVVTSGYWGASSLLFGEKFFDTTTKWSDKLTGSIFEGIEFNELTLRALLFSSVNLSLLSIILLITFFSLFSRRTTAGHVFIKISVFISILFIAFYYTVMASASMFALLLEEPDVDLGALTEFLDKVLELSEHLDKVCYVSMIGGGVAFVIGVILTICKFSEPYNTTCYQFFRSLYFIAISVFYFLVVIKGNTNETINKIAGFLKYSLPYYLVLVSIFMFASAKMKKRKVKA